MGSAGIRRRKPAHHLPKVSSSAERGRGDPEPGVAGPPNVMWPGTGSGFEASPFSPAGRAQGMALLADGLRRRLRRGRRPGRRPGPGVLLGLVLAWVVVVGLIGAAALAIR